jgi:hypothetical protein
MRRRDTPNPDGVKIFHASKELADSRAIARGIRSSGKPGEGRRQP